MTTLRFGHVRMSVEGPQILLRGMENLEHAGFGVFADAQILAAAAEAPKLQTLCFGHWATVPENRLTQVGAATFARLRGLESLHTGEQDPPEGGSIRDVTETVAKIENCLRKRKLKVGFIQGEMELYRTLFWFGN